MKSFHFIKALDVLYLRGNKLFGEAGSFGESLVVPRPSVVAGALRSGLATSRGYELREFAQGEITNDTELGTPDRPGTFVLSGLQLARSIVISGQLKYERLFPVPHDLFVKLDSNGKACARRVEPKPLEMEILSSSPFALLPTLSQRRRSKPSSTRYFLTTKGWNTHLRGQQIEDEDLISSDQFWKLETRIGIGLDKSTNSVEKGHLFTSEAVNYKKKENDSESIQEIGFLAEVSGATLPDSMAVKLGGDGRCAFITKIQKDELLSVDNCLADIEEQKRCRIILTSPGLFQNGWALDRFDQSKRPYQIQLDGVVANLDCAIVRRAEVISGFDIASLCPKPAESAAPIGSVYWLSSMKFSKRSLKTLLEGGLWSSSKENFHRRAEGFNRFQFATY